MKLKDWTNWAEILASIGVVVSLLLLTIQVRENTRALERQAINDRSATLNQPFTNGSNVPEILAKVKTVDGPEPLEQAYASRYGMSYEEAAIWTRYVSEIWTSLEADYAQNGESPELHERIQMLLLMPDDEIFWRQGAVQVSNHEFRAYVRQVQAPPDTDLVRDIRRKLQKLKEERSRSG